MEAKTLDEETSKKVIRQVEFYFSDSNLPRDKFLKQTVSESEDGLVSLALICSFSRMRNHLGLGDVKPDEVSDDTVKAVAETLRSSDFLKVSEDGKKIGRKTEMAKAEEVIEQLDSRTIAASPLPYDVKLEDVESFFAQCAKVNSVRLPRHVSDKRLFCGTALVEFSAEEGAEEVLKQTLVYVGANLELTSKKDFDAEREKQMKEYENSHPPSNRKDSEETSYPKGLIVAFSLKSKSVGGDSKPNSSEKQVSNVDEPKVDGQESVTGVSKETDEAPKNDMEEPTEKVESDEKGNGETGPGNEGNEEKDKEMSSEDNGTKNGEKAHEGKSAVVTYKDNMDVVLREDLKAVFQKFGTVKYIDFKMGANSGYIRFEEPEASQKARAAAVLSEEGGLAVKNFIATLEPVTGEAEKEYWSQISGNQERHHKGHKGRGGKHHHRGGKQGRRSRDYDSGRPNKIQKVAA